MDSNLRCSGDFSAVLGGLGGDGVAPPAARAGEKGLSAGVYFGGDASARGGEALFRGTADASVCGTLGGSHGAGSAPARGSPGD